VQTRYRRDETTLWVPRPVTTEADEVTPMVSLSYQANDNIMVYATYQEGFRGGGANQRPANVNQVVPFGPEYLDNLEFGIKSDLGGKVRLNASIFDMTYTDMQLGAVTADATGAVAFLTANAGEAKITGLEVEVQGAIGDHWVLDATIGTLDFQYKDLGAASAAAIQAAGLGTGLSQPSLDDVAPRTPDYTASFGFNYLVDLPGGSSLTWRTSFSHQDDIFFGANNDPLSLAEGYTLANLRLTWMSANQEWEASLFGTNITDELYVQSKLNFETSFGSIENGYGRPEEWGLSIRRHF
jgi:iron complex outermembrane receptor protein